MHHYIPGQPLLHSESAPEVEEQLQERRMQTFRRALDTRQRTLRSRVLRALSTPDRGVCAACAACAGVIGVRRGVYVPDRGVFVVRIKECQRISFSKLREARPMSVGLNT